VSPNLILSKNWKKLAKITYFLIQFFGEPSNSGKRDEAKVTNSRLEIYSAFSRIELL
jgi:hypothetical protein